MILENYKPREVLKHFEAISQIPRGSGNEKAVSDYIATFATNCGCKAVQDKLHNLIIFKDANGSGEGKPPIILQAHLDMVCEKNADTVHDFLTDPINLYVDGDYIKAHGTTLGADNGLGVALCMALLEATDIPHPPLEIVLTTEEETGMDGAENLDFSLFTGKQMVNLDNSNDTCFIMGCAAGTTVEYTIPADWEAVAANTAALDINVSGLTGGHSGGDISRERGNALRITGQILAALSAEMDVRIASVSGGMKVNAIPREATATITIPKTDTDKAKNILETCQVNLATQYRATDSGLQISWETGSVGKVLPAGVGQNVVASLNLMPNGVIARSMEIERLVNSSCNLGVVETTHECVKISAMPRGAARFYNQATETQISQLAQLTGAQVVFMMRSPAWPYNPDSELLKIAQECYKPVFGQEAKVTAIHAGLECGIFMEKIPGLDIISFGPTNHDLHTPDERLSISSTEKSWEFLKKLLATL